MNSKINPKTLQDEILDLKRKNDVSILAHYYQSIEVQEIADYLGDSLQLSLIAKEKINTKYIIFAGVMFMAEIASILNQDKKVLIPDKSSYCPMAAYLTPSIIRDFKNNYPDLPVVTYINSTTSVKAESDICCTSSNAVKIVKKISDDFGTDTVLFGPDSNLADYTEKKSNIKTIKMPGNGHCYIHSRLSLADVTLMKKKYPNAKVLAHPECAREVQELADFVGATAKMYDYVKNSPNEIDEFILGTEIGLLERLKTDFPENDYYLIKDKMLCRNMKKHNLELIKKLFENLDDNQFSVKVPNVIAEKAILPINRMLNYT